MPDSILIAKQASRFLRRLKDRALYERLAVAIESLRKNPFPPGHVKLKNTHDAFRIRVGDWRILYEVQADQLIIHNIGHRKNIYQ